jgi:hypothetical protein
MSNVLEQLRRSEPLSAKDRTIHEQGMVSVLRTLRDELDAAVLAAYGWSDLAAPLAAHGSPAQAEAVETLLERLVALNARRAAEEAAGTVRWLRPEFQDPARRRRGGLARRLTPRGNGFADTVAVCPRTATHLASRQAVPGGGDLGGDEQRSVWGRRAQRAS